MPAALPNILWFVTTQWRGQACGFAGDANASTPYLDGWAAQSVVFAQAFSNHPFGPFARALLLTGRFSPANGVRDYWDPLPRRAHTVAHRLRDAGYATAFFGKWHLARRDRHAPIVGETHARTVVAPEERGGFEFWEGFEGGFLLNDPWLHGTRLAEPAPFSGYQADVVCERAAAWLEDHEVGRGSGTRKADEVADDRDQGRDGRGFSGRASTRSAPRRGEPEVPFSALGSGGRANRRPVFCVVSLEPPHPPYGAAVPPGIGERDPALVRLAPNVPRGGEIETTVRREIAGYYRHVEATDRAIGRMLATVDRDSTAVFITSVHGDLHGAHGLFRKGWPYEEAVRVPLVASWPGASPARIFTPVSLADLPVTALALAGQPPPSNWCGADLRNLAPDAARTVLLGMPSVPPFPKQCPQVWRGLRSRSEMFAVGADGRPWLHFDLADDPWQQRNLANEPAIADAHGRLSRELARLLRQAGDSFVVAI